MDKFETWKLTNGFHNLIDASRRKAEYNYEKIFAQNFC